MSTETETIMKKLGDMQNSLQNTVEQAKNELMEELVAKINSLENKTKE